MRRYCFLAMICLLLFLSACHTEENSEKTEIPQYEFTGDEVLIYYSCFYRWPKEVKDDFDSFLVYADGTVITGSNLSDSRTRTLLIENIPQKKEEYLDLLQNMERHECCLKEVIDQLILDVQSINLESDGEKYKEELLVPDVINDTNKYKIQSIQWSNEKQEDWFLIFSDRYFNTYDEHAQAARELVEQTEIFKTWKAACEEKRIKNLREK